MLFIFCNDTFETFFFDYFLTFLTEKKINKCPLTKAGGWGVKIPCPLTYVSFWNLNKRPLTPGWVGGVFLNGHVHYLAEFL